MLTVGLDVHERTSSVCILDPQGRVIKEQAIKGHPRVMIEQLRGHAQPMRVCFEANCNYGWLYEHLSRFAHSVTVAHPGHLRMIFRATRKNDRVDAKKLATLLFLDQVPAVHVPKCDVRAWRSLIEYRRRLVDSRTRIKNRLRALLRSRGIEAPSGRKLWTIGGRVWLADLSLDESVATLQRDQWLEELTDADRRIKRAEKMLERTAEGHPGVTLLRTIPGVGIRTAEAMAAYIDDPHRFTKNKCIGSYFGLTPRQDSSAGVNRLGRIGKDGPATGRKLLVEAAWQAIRRSPGVKAYHQRIQGGRKERNRQALVATAHYLARVMLAMLKTGEAWREPDSNGSVQPPQAMPEMTCKQAA